MISDKHEDFGYENLTGKAKEKDMNLVEHKLHSSWNLWFVSRKLKDHSIPYENRLTDLGNFNSLESFLNIYAFMKPAMLMERNIDISLFKHGYKPLWENCPNSGLIFIRYKKNEECKEIDLKWEKILFALVGEQFDEPLILGTTLSIRGRETIIELWFTYNKNDKLKNSLIAKFKDLLEFSSDANIYFKDNSLSVQDKSTLKNVEQVNYAKRKNTHF